MPSTFSHHVHTAAKEGGSAGGAKPGLIGSKAKSKIYRGYKCYYQIMENTGPSTVEISTVSESERERYVGEHKAQHRGDQHCECMLLWRAYCLGQV
jgi:hypothetical protein